MVTGTTRQRDVIRKSVVISRVFNGPTQVGPDGITVSSQGYRQSTTSHGNRVSGLSQSGHKGRWYREDIGGSFQTSRVDTEGSLFYINVSSGPKPAGIWYQTVGDVGIYDNNLSLNYQIFPSSKSQMDAYGTKAIARMLPTNPLAGMGQFLGELRDLPKVPDVDSWRDTIHNFQHATRNFDFDKASRRAAGEYLNGVFGWVPFVSDLKKFFATARDAQPQIEKYVKGANKVLRRRYNYPEDRTTTASVNRTYLFPPLNLYQVNRPGDLYVSVEKITKRWCSAAFTYYLPSIEPDDTDFTKMLIKLKLQEAYANRLFGLRLTPDLLYKLTPWSWAADWITTAGDVVHNWSAFANDGLVLKYSYMMETVFQNETWVCTGLQTVDGQTINGSQARRTTVKSRTIGTPYGFGLNSAAFTAKQWGVIAALGISHQPLSINK